MEKSIVPMRAGLSRPAISWLASIVALVALKLALVWAQPVRGISTAGYDDALFVGLTNALAHSSWLGDYTHLTLAKGPGAPMVFAAARAFGVPLPIAQQLLYAAACALVALAFAPIVQRRTTTVVLFAVMLFNPATFDAGVMTRVSRSMVYTAAILATVAACVGLASWNARSRTARTLWGAAGGLAAGLAWITREETVMIVPALAIIAAGAALWIRQKPSRGPLSTFAMSLALSAMLALALVGTVSFVNYANYGSFTVTEIRGGPYARAYGALTRIPPFDEGEMIAMTEEARRTAYAVSPAFRELEPSFEGARGDYWIAESKYFVGLPTRGRGLHRAWFMWALRDAVAAAGHYASADEANAYFERVANEVNAACIDPTRRCSPPRSSPVPAMNRDRAMSVSRSWIRAATFVIRLRDFTAWSGASIGDEAGLARFREIALWPVLPTVAPPREGWRLGALNAIGKGIAFLSPAASSCSALAFVAAFALAVKRRRFELELVVAAGALMLAVACVTVVAMVDALAFPAINMLYLAPAYPAIGLFWCASTIAIARVIANP